MRPEQDSIIVAAQKLQHRVVDGGQRKRLAYEELPKRQRTIAEHYLHSARMRRKKKPGLFETGLAAFDLGQMNSRKPFTSVATGVLMTQRHERGCADKVTIRIAPDRF